MAKSGIKRIEDLEISVRPVKLSPVLVYWRADLGYYHDDGPGGITQLTDEQYEFLGRHNDIILLRYEKRLRSTDFLEVNCEQET